MSLFFKLLVTPPFFAQQIESSHDEMRENAASSFGYAMHTPNGRRYFTRSRWLLVPYAPTETVWGFAQTARRYFSQVF